MWKRVDSRGNPRHFSARTPWADDPRCCARRVVALGGTPQVRRRAFGNRVDIGGCSLEGLSTIKSSERKRRLRRQQQTESRGSVACGLLSALSVVSTIMNDQ